MRKISNIMQTTILNQNSKQNENNDIYVVIWLSVLSALCTNFTGRIWSFKEYRRWINLEMVRFITGRRARALPIRVSIM